VYSVDLPLFFSLDREDFALTDAFFGHYRELQRIATREVRWQSGCSCACRMLCIDRVQLLLVSTHASAPHPHAVLALPLWPSVGPAGS
jgi:hypothetical protein